MRRAEREVMDPVALDRILQGSQVVFLALRARLRRGAGLFRV